MPRNFFRAFVVFAVLVTVLSAPAALAQEETDQQAVDAFENEFKAFSEKMQAARTDSAPAEPAAAAPDPAASPLGPAATLPVGEGLPPALATGAVPQTPEELQALMEAETAEQMKELEIQTFKEALKSLLPLTPEQIRETLEAFKKSREAAETPITVPAPIQEVMTASLDPADAPFVVKIAADHVTTLTIVDATGAPWAIQDVSWAGPYAVTAPEEGGHVIRITSSSAHGTGNVSFRLVDMITPITMRLVTGLDEVHYRLDVRIPKAGPLAKTPLIEYGGLKAVAGKDDQMVSVLEGMPPTDAERLLVEGVDGRTTAYRMTGRIYLRTPLTLLSPGWDASVSSSDGMNVYSLAEAPVMLLSDGGRMVRAHVVANNEVAP